MDLGLIMALPILAIFALLIVAPPVAVWRALSRQASGRAAWLLPALALIGPFVAVFVFVVLMWLPAYSGQCGGWLGFDSAEPELFGTIFELIEDDLAVSEALSFCEGKHALDVAAQLRRNRRLARPNRGEHAKDSFGGHRCDR